MNRLKRARASIKERRRSSPHERTRGLTPQGGTLTTTTLGVPVLNEAKALARECLFEETNHERFTQWMKRHRATGPFRHRSNGDAYSVYRTCGASVCKTCKPFREQHGGGEGIGVFTHRARSPLYPGDKVSDVAPSRLAFVASTA